MFFNKQEIPIKNERYLLVLGGDKNQTITCIATGCFIRQKISHLFKPDEFVDLFEFKDKSDILYYTFDFYKIYEIENFYG